MVSEAYENLVLMLSGGRVTPELPTDQARTGWDAMETMLPGADGVQIEDATLAGRPARWLRGGSGSTVAIHFHGGGYVIGSAKSHTPFASHLAAALGGRVLLPDYRLAPEDPAPAALEDAVRVHLAVLDEGVDPTDVILTGDSAGGGLAIALAVQLRDAGSPRPAAVSVISPWTDATLGCGSMQSKVDEDIILSPELMRHWRDQCVAGLDATDERVSPVRAELSGLPPIQIQVGTRELLLDDATAFADRAARAGVEVDLVVCEDMIHIWPVLGAGVVPEAQEAIDRIAAFAARYTATK